MISDGGEKITEEDEGPAFVQGELYRLWREISLGVYVLNGYGCDDVAKLIDLSPIVSLPIGHQTE
jgi:hypothetical protein